MTNEAKQPIARAASNTGPVVLQEEFPKIAPEKLDRLEAFWKEAKQERSLPCTDPEDILPLIALARFAVQSAGVAVGDSRPQLTVWNGSLPESNGRLNFTAILMRKSDTLLAGMEYGFTIARSEYPGRVAYEADCVRYLIGERPDKPFILDYDAKEHSGYVEASETAQPDRSGAGVPEFDFYEWFNEHSEGVQLRLDKSYDEFKTAVRDHYARSTVPASKAEPFVMPGDDTRRLDFLLNFDRFSFEIINQVEHLLDCRGRIAGKGATKRAAIDAAARITPSAPLAPSGTQEQGEKFDELVRDLYNFEGGRHFALRLEKLLDESPLKDFRKTHQGAKS